MLGAIAGSLRLQLTMIALGLFGLALAAMVSSLYYARAADDDASTLRQAAAMRAEVYRMAFYNEQGNFRQVQASAARFDRALREENLHRMLEQADPALAQRYSALRRRWHTDWRQPLTMGPSFAAFTPSTDRIETLAVQLDDFVTAVEARTEARLARLTLLEGSIFVIFLALMLVAVQHFRLSLMRPVRELAAGIERLTGGWSATRVDAEQGAGMAPVMLRFNNMAAALERIEQAERMENQAREAEKRVMLALLEERSALARECHDCLGQSLTYIKIQVTRMDDALKAPEPSPAALREISTELRRGVDEAHQNLRDLLAMFRLRVEQPDLRSGLRAVVDEFARWYPDITFDFQCTGRVCELNPGQRIHLIHIAREALNNVGRHARAHRAAVTLEGVEAGAGTPDWLRLTVTDDGVGITGDVERGHYGIEIMRDRANQMGGQLTIEADAKAGSRVVAEVPCQ